MDLVFHEVGQLEHIYVANGDGVIELLAGASVVEFYFAVGGKARTLQFGVDEVFGSAVEHRGGDLVAQGFGCPAEVGFEDLADVHTVRHAEWVEDNVNRAAIGQERHILVGEDPGDNTL